MLYRPLNRLVCLTQTADIVLLFHSYMCVHAIDYTSFRSHFFDFYFVPIAVYVCSMYVLCVLSISRVCICVRDSLFGCLAMYRWLAEIMN